MRRKRRRARPILHRARGVLPEAPEPALIPKGESSSLQANFSFDPSLPGSWAVDIAPNSPERVALKDCPTDTTHARECRMHWRQLLISSAVFNAFQNAGNVYTGYWYRWETTHGKWFERWFNSDLGWDWNDWNDGNPAMDQYVGHPFMGGITNSLWIQNDPKGSGGADWRARLLEEPPARHAVHHHLSFPVEIRAVWRSGVGHIGDHPTHNFNTHPRNDTGIVELVTTPVGGLGWTMAEDALDKHVVKSFEQSPRRPVSLLLISFLTPTRATANILRLPRTLVSR